MSVRIIAQEIRQHGGVGLFGDVANGNYVEVDANGYITLYGDATVWDDLRIPVTSTSPGLSNPPDIAKFLDNGSGSQGVYIQWFDKTIEEEMYFTAQMPHAWLEGTDIEPHVHWVPKSNGGAGTVVNWGIEYAWSNIGSVFGNTTIISSNTAIPSGDLVASTHYLTEVASIDGTGKTFSSMLACRIFRDAGGALGTDDYDYDAGLLEIDFHYQIAYLGSDSEYS